MSLKKTIVCLNLILLSLAPFSQAAEPAVFTPAAPTVKVFSDADPANPDLRLIELSMTGSGDKPVTIKIAMTPQGVKSVDINSQPVDLSNELKGFYEVLSPKIYDQILKNSAPGADPSREIFSKLSPVIDSIVQKLSFGVVKNVTEDVPQGTGAKVLKTMGNVGVKAVSVVGTSAVNLTYYLPIVLASSLVILNTYLLATIGIEVTHGFGSLVESLLVHAVQSAGIIYAAESVKFFMKKILPDLNVRFDLITLTLRHMKGLPDLQVGKSCALVLKRLGTVMSSLRAGGRG